MWGAGLNSKPDTKRVEGGGNGGMGEVGASASKGSVLVHALACG
ncbi:Uncharacterised protein [Corynebacterium diphtheriae]|nr:Uncharacterised protein [Corynebacterium diphtheriae]